MQAMICFMVLSFLFFFQNRTCPFVNEKKIDIYDFFPFYEWEFE